MPCFPRIWYSTWSSTWKWWQERASTPKPGIIRQYCKHYVRKWQYRMCSFGGISQAFLETRIRRRSVRKWRKWIRQRSRREIPTRHGEEPDSSLIRLSAIFARALVISRGIAICARGDSREAEDELEDSVHSSNFPWVKSWLCIFFPCRRNSITLLCWIYVRNKFVNFLVLSRVFVFRGLQFAYTIHF